MEDNRLFGQFPPVTTERWEEAIERDLKGADYERRLVWHTAEGFDLRPYYRADDLETSACVASNPGEAPYTRGGDESGAHWEVRQDIFATDPTEAGAVARVAVERGATSLGFSAAGLSTTVDLEALLHDVSIDKVALNFRDVTDPLALIQMLAEYARRRGIDTASLHGSAGCTPIGYAMLHGHYATDEAEEMARAARLTEWMAKEMPQMHALTADARLIHEAGATIVQQVGFGLAQAEELMARLTDEGLSPDMVAAAIRLEVGVGSSYFMEMAKLRAARLLWSKITAQYGVAEGVGSRLWISATTSRRNQSVYDPYVNMLRSTTETMSAALGGADEITVTPFDAAYRQADDFGYRIGRNQQLLLREEAYIDKTADPAAGSYYIETLTDKIARGAWECFMAVQNAGGMCSALRKGVVQDAVEQSAAQRRRDTAMRRRTIVGTNQYANPQERMVDHMGEAHIEQMDEATELRPLHLERDAEPFEQLRLQTERSAHRPKVLLLTYGNPTMRKARAGFAGGFYGVAGYETIDHTGYATPEEGANAALEVGADVVVLCSSDEEYPQLAAQVCPLLRGRVKRIVIAGNPVSAEGDYRALGVDDFVHVKTNALEHLQDLQKVLLPEE